MKENKNETKKAEIFTFKTERKVIMKHELMSHTSNQHRYTIDYFYRGKDRTAVITEVSSTTGPRFYWFGFKSQPPRYIKQDGDVWTSEGLPELPPGLADALIAGIKSFKTRG